MLDDLLPHCLPKQADTVRVRRDFQVEQNQRGSVRERIILPHDVSCGRHGFADVIGNSIPSDIAEGSGQTPGNSAVASIQ